MLAIAAACWFGPAWTCDCPVWTNAVWPSAGHTVLGSASPRATRCSLRRTSTGNETREDDEQSRGTELANPNPTGRCSWRFAVAHARESGQSGVASPYVVFDMPTK